MNETETGKNIKWYMKPSVFFIVQPIFMTMVVFATGTLSWPEIAERSRILTFIIQVLVIVFSLVLSYKPLDWRYICLNLLTSLTIWLFLITLPAWYEAVLIKKLASHISPLLLGSICVAICSGLLVSLNGSRKPKWMFFAAAIFNIVTVYQITIATGSMINAFDNY